MANKERGIFKVTTDSGREVNVQVSKCYGERWYSVEGSGYAYDTKQEIKECPILNNKETNNESN